MNEYTKVVKGTPGVWQCNDCGAHADKKENVVHHDSCTPGESKRWEEQEDIMQKWKVKGACYGNI